MFENSIENSAVDLGVTDRGFKIFIITNLYHGLPRLGKFLNHLHETQDFQRIPIMIKLQEI